MLSKNKKKTTATTYLWKNNEILNFEKTHKINVLTTLFFFIAKEEESTKRKSDWFREKQTCTDTTQSCDTELYKKLNQIIILEKEKNALGYKNSENNEVPVHFNVSFQPSIRNC